MVRNGGKLSATRLAAFLMRYLIARAEDEGPLVGCSGQTLGKKQWPRR